MAVAAALISTAPMAFAATVTPGPYAPTDLGSLPEGTVLEGPLGPSVNTSFVLVDPSSTPLAPIDPPTSIGDGQGRVSLENATYRYIQEVTPGVDLVPDNAGFASDQTAPIDAAQIFATGFLPAGFTGTVGYSFADADAAGVSFEIQATGSGFLWVADNADGWNLGESIRFFFESTQPPEGPNGAYILGSGDAFVGVGVGPIPSAVPVPAALPLFLVGMGGLAAVARRRR